MLRALSGRVSEDMLALRVLLFWIAGQAEDAKKVVLEAIVSIFEVLPLTPSCFNVTNNSPMMASKLAFMLCLARQLQFLLCINSCPATISCVAQICKLGPAITSLASCAIRLCFAFGSLDYRYDLVQKLLKYTIKLHTVAESAMTSPEKDPVPTNPIPVTDDAYLFFRRMSRAESIHVLEKLPQGSFLLRPHETQEFVLFLSFSTGSADGIKHAIVRKDISPAGEFSYRCGRVGPCATVHETLTDISNILPSPLIFDASVLPPVETQQKRSKRASSLHEVTSPAEGAGCFTTSVEDMVFGSYSPQASADLSWDANGEFWWSFFSDLKQDNVAPEGTKSKYEKEYRSSMLLPDVRPTISTRDTIVETDDPILVGTESFSEEIETKPVDDDDIEMSEGSFVMPMKRHALGALMRGVTYMLAMKTIHKQLYGHSETLKQMLETETDVETSLRLSVSQRLSSKLNRSQASLVQKQKSMHAAYSIVDILFEPLTSYISNYERRLVVHLTPPLPMNITTLASPDTGLGEELMQQILHETRGVSLRHVKLPASTNTSGSNVYAPGVTGVAVPSPGGGNEQTIECFESIDGVQWLSTHPEDEALRKIMQKCGGDGVATPDDVLKWLWEKRILQNIVIGGSSSYGSKHQYFRYIDPWEVSVVQDQSTVLSSARLGRGWYGAVSAYNAVALVDCISSYLREKTMADMVSELTGEEVSSGFMKVWETLRAEAWLVMTISTAFEQTEREVGGPVNTELKSSTLGAADPYHSSLARHLYRNVLFSRLVMPHRFVAVLQIDTFALKDLAPHKFMAGVASAPIEVYAVLRIVRSSSKRQENKKSLPDTLVTPVRKIEPMKHQPSSQPSEYSWREQAVMRFPLPDRVVSIGPFADGGDRYMRQPPRTLQISVYETRSFFSDQKIGDLELPLSGLSDERPFRDWLPLNSEKGSAWFVHMHLQLRFLLMAKDQNKDTTIR